MKICRLLLLPFFLCALSPLPLFSSQASDHSHWQNVATVSQWKLAMENAHEKSLPFTQPIPLAFGGGQYISSDHGQRIKRGHSVRNLKRGYLRDIDIDTDSGTLTIKKSKLYNIDYFLSIKMVIDTTASVAEYMALKVNGNEIARVALSLASSTTFIEGTTLVTAIYSATSSTSMYLQKGDKVQLVLSKKSTLPHWGDKRVRVYAANEDLAASLFIESQETAGST